MANIVDEIETKPIFHLSRIELFNILSVLHKCPSNQTVRDVLNKLFTDVTIKIVLNGGA